MQIVATDILADLCGLSLGLILLVLPFGLALWLLGWWGHRFWIVLAATVTAGIVGLNEATQWQTQPIIVALLLAVAVGVLALALVRVIAFIAGGAAGMSLAQMIFPTLNQPMIAFLICGLLSLLVFRWCFMGLTSFVGSGLLGYASLAHLHYYEMLDAVRWSEDNAVVLNSICGILTFVGFLGQIWLERRRNRQRPEEREDDADGRGPVGTILGVFGRRSRSKREAA